MRINIFKDIPQGFKIISNIKRKPKVKRKNEKLRKKIIRSSTRG